MDFINQICESTTDNNLLSELFSVDEDNLEESRDTKQDGEDYILGTTYGKGAWITDPDNKVIYKKLMPLYFNFLKGWYHLD